MGSQLSNISEPKNYVVSIVIPCYNEEGNIVSLVSEALEVTTRHPSIEFIFVDNGSTDKTRELLEAMTDKTANFKIAVVPINKGYGFGIRSGLKEASGKFVGWTHADHQTKLTDIELALEVLKGKENKVLVKGRRYGRPLSDRLFTFSMSLFESALFRSPLSDINAQPTLFSRELLGDVLAGPDDFSLDLFTYVQAKRNGIDVLRFPVTFGPRFSGESKWNTSANARWKFIRRTMSFSLRLVFTKSRSR